MWSTLEGSLLAELIPNALAWAPALKRGTGEAFSTEQTNSWFLFRVLDHASEKHVRGGEFSVPHYPPAAIRDAFGPLSLDRVIGFCRLLDQLLKCHGRVAVSSEAEDENERTNVATLLGAFLIICKDWSVGEVEEKLSSEADRGYTRIWPEAKLAQQPPSLLRVRHCWLGVHYAKSKGMLAAFNLADVASSTTPAACDVYRNMMLQYDCSWICPQEVAVGADPVTVICDPNPVTCPSLLPKDVIEATAANRGLQTSNASKAGTPGQVLPSDDGNEDQRTNSRTSDPKLKDGGSIAKDPLASLVSQTRTVSDKSLGTFTGVVSAVSVRSMRILSGSSLDGKAAVYDGSEGQQSCHTVCKEYGAVLDAEGLPPADDFVTWCHKQKLQLLVRANHSNEPGLKEVGGSYDPQLLLPHGLRHYDTPFDDTHGAVPRGKTVAKVLEQCEAAQGPVMVHCKGGFGRSMVLACCYIIYKHDIPGVAMLGWSRIVRPGAIITGEQEKFLCRLKGREDLTKYMADSACCALL